MKIRQAIILFAALLGFVCCKPEHADNVTLTFSAAASKYASLKETVFVKADNPEANAYTRSEDWTALLEGPKQYFLQVGWNSGQTKSSECVKRCLEAYGKAVLCSVNLLHVNHDYIPEYSISESQLASLFELYPECQMVHTDCPQEMISILEK